MPTSCPPEEPIFTPDERREIKAIFNEAISEYFKNTGTIGRNILLGTAAIVGSIIVILGGLKTMAAWIGISIMRQ